MRPSTTPLRSPLWLALAVLFLHACSGTQLCSSATCPGCCVNNVCFEGGCGSSSVDAGAQCLGEDSSCATGRCCATSFWGDPLVCKNGGCFPDCKTDGSCSSNRECCASPRSGAGSFCDLSKNRCSLCWNKGHECIPRISECCPGFTCGSKPATPNFFECL